MSLPIFLSQVSWILSACFSDRLLENSLFFCTKAAHPPKPTVLRATSFIVTVSTPLSDPKTLPPVQGKLVYPVRDRAFDTGSLICRTGPGGGTVWSAWEPGNKRGRGERSSESDRTGDSQGSSDRLGKPITGRGGVPGPARGGEWPGVPHGHPGEPGVPREGAASPTASTLGASRGRDANSGTRWALSGAKREAGRVSVLPGPRAPPRDSAPPPPKGGPWGYA